MKLQSSEQIPATLSDLWEKEGMIIVSAHFLRLFYGEHAAQLAKAAFAGRDRRRIKREMNKARRVGERCAWQEK